MEATAFGTIIRDMKAFRATVLAVFALLLAPPAVADQTDTRLDDLFVELTATRDLGRAAEVERRIWAIWREHGDGAVVALMDQGYRAMAAHDARVARRAFDQVVELAPDFAEGWNARATLNYLVGSYPASLADIERTLALEPRHFGALSGRGLVYAALEEWDRSLASFEAALEVNPHMEGAKANLRAIREEIGEKDI